MADAILLEVLTPERKVFSARVSEVQFPTEFRGYYGILPEHTAVMTPLGDGLLHFLQDGQKRHLTVFGGFAEVGAEHVTILAREAETVDMLDVVVVEAAFQAAQKAVKDARTPEEVEAAQVQLQLATVRKQALGQ